MADPTDAPEPGALAQWQARYWALVAEGNSHLDAIDLINREDLALARAARNEHARTSSPSALTHKRVAPGRKETVS